MMESEQPFGLDLETVTDAAKEGMALAHYARATPERMAVTSNFGERTFGELNARANQLVRAWRRAGIGSGDSVALLMGNRPEFAEVYKASLRAGVRLTPINWHLSGDEVAYIVDNCEAKVFITEDCYREAAEHAIASSLGLVQSLAIGEVAGAAAYETTLGAEDPSDIDDPEYGRYMLYTSGTTGRPKGVWRKKREPILPQWETGRAPMRPDTDCCLLTGPAYHAAPLMSIVRALVSGVPVVMMDRWDPEETLRLIDEYKVTHSHMVATMFHRMLQLPDDVRTKYDLSSLKSVNHGAAPCPVHVKQAMIEWFGPVINEYYAATEGGGGFTVTSEEWLKKPGTVGKPPPEYDNKILDDEGNECAPNEVGTIYMKAIGDKFEYYKDPDKTEGSYRGDYFTLGDMGYFDEDGYLFLTGRTAEVIISGGVNIYPQEVDNEVMKHPAVHEVCTIGIPNEEWGEEVRTVVQLKDDIEASDDVANDIILFTRTRLAHFKCPRQIDFAEDLPRLPTGKIQRRKVRDPYWAGRDKQI
ncbi:MAG: AMP-binding protein [Gammaproteobacteria bacterium]|nr:AMP-binding protein [Gammaproteobacteria bacterium]